MFKYIDKKLKLTKTNLINDLDKVDYNLKGFKKEKTFEKGELIKTDYYEWVEINEPIIENGTDGRPYVAGANSTAFYDLILTEERTFSRDENDIVQSRELNINFYDTEGGVGHTKSIIKEYSSIDAIEELYTRHSNIINECKYFLINEIGVENSVDLLQSLSNEISLYKEGNTEVLKEAINNSDKPYLTTEIKASIIEIISY